MAALPKRGRLGYAPKGDMAQYEYHDFSRIVIDLDCDSLTLEIGQEVHILKLSELKHLFVGIQGVTDRTHREC